VSLRGKKTRKIVEVGLIDIKFVSTELTYTQTAFYHPFRITWPRKSAERQELLYVSKLFHWGEGTSSACLVLIVSLILLQVENAFLVSWKGANNGREI
jgi:hypothetical protein